MTIWKRIAAGVTALSTALALASCKDTTYVLTAGDEKVNAGIYIEYLESQMYYQMLMLSYSGVQKDYLNQEVEDGVKLSQYVEDYAYKQTKEYLAIERQFDELGLEISDKDESSINSDVSDLWTENGEYYEYIGISRDSYKKVQLNAKKRDMIFDKYYEAGGLEEVTDEALAAYVNENYLRYENLTFNKAKDDSGAAAKADADKYLALAKEAKSFDDVIEQYNEDQEAESETDSDTDSDSDSSTDDTSSATDNTSSSDDTSSAADTTSSSDDTSSAADNTSSSDDTSSAGDSSEDGTDSETEKEPSEADDYPNDRVVNKSDYSDNELYKFIDKTAEIGVPVIYEDDNAYYLIYKRDMAERTQYPTENRATIMKSMKSEEFQTKIDGWVGEFKFKDNTEAIERYTAKEIYDRQTKYSEKNKDA